ncbi:hypothetical protein [uncultured Oscillibacter sp.]|uniref:hypothetical protein n=1 Tax=uncultured Oscillibacter sp. TaxID=876091 RepID=UPI002805BFE6|nr:hypothetical protein [uncultured Oscillibacter sp.]
MKTMNEILADYTSGKATPEETNAALEEIDCPLTITPGKNELTEADIRATTVGYYPDMANGYGLLDSGTGIMEKVHVTAGVLDNPINEVQPDGSTNMLAYVHICGKVFEVFGDKLGFPRK